MQTLTLVPDLRLGVDYGVLGKSSGAIMRKAHIALTDAEYGRFMEAFTQRLSLHRA